jgi:RNA polymerase sigma factor (sigma-70 family)
MDGIDLGSEAGQDALVLEIHSLAHKHAARMRQPRGDAEDFAQDVVLSCLGEIREGRWDIGDRDLDAHIACLVRRRIAVHTRQRRRRMERDMEHVRDLEGGVHAWMGPDVEFEATVIEEIEAEAFGKLPRVCRATFELVRNEDLSYASAAERLGVTAETVKAHIVKAQRMFRSVMERKGIAAPRRKRAAAG